MYTYNYHLLQPIFLQVKQSLSGNTSRMFKGGLDLRKSTKVTKYINATGSLISHFFLLWFQSQKTVPNHNTVHDPPKEKLLRTVIRHVFGGPN